MPGGVMVRLPTPARIETGPGTVDAGTGRNGIRARHGKGRRHRPGRRRRPSTAPAAAVTIYTAGVFALGALDQATSNPPKAALCAVATVILFAVATALIVLNPQPPGDTRDERFPQIHP